LQANLRNDAKALAEVTNLLADLRDTWARIGKNGAPAAPASAPDATGTGRRLVVSA